MDWRKKFAGESLPLPITNLLIAEMSSCSTASHPFCRQWSTRRPPRKVASSTRQSNTMKTRLFEKKELASGVPKPIQEITALLSTVYDRNSLMPYYCQFLSVNSVSVIQKQYRKKQSRNRNGQLYQFLFV